MADRSHGQSQCDESFVEGSRRHDLVYDRRTIFLHWLTAILIVLLWTIGQTVDWFPRGAPRIAARSTHILLGATLFCVLCIRIQWRALHGTRLPLAHQGLMGRLAKLTHYALYGLLVATVLLGLANVWVRGDSFFGLFSVPKFDPDNKELKSLVEDLHATAANTLVIVAGLHALAALLYHFALRDGVLRRMLPGRGR